MSLENVEIVRRCYELFAKGDSEGLLEHIDPDIQISEPSQVPGASTFSGRSEFLQAIDHWAGEFEDFRIDVEQLIDGGDVVVGDTRQHGRGKQSGVPVDIRVVNAFTLRDRKVVRWEMYATLDEALEAVGLRE